MSRIALLGVPLDAIDLDQTVERISALMRSHLPGTPPAYVATINVDFLTNLYGWRFSRVKNQKLLSILRGAECSVADGMPLVWLSKILGSPLPERIAGADLTIRLLERAAVDKRKVYLLGGAPGVAEKTAGRIEIQFPGAQIVGTAAPWVDADGTCADEARILDDINRAAPDLLLIAMGNPKQELWFHRYRTQLHSVGAAIGVGGTFNFVTGQVQRAPKKWQEWGCEWIWRLLQEPRRLWKRYALGIIKLAWYLLPYLVLDKAGRIAQANEPLLPAARLINGNVRELDLRFARYLRPASLAYLIEQQVDARRGGQSLHLRNTSPLLRALLHSSRLGDLLDNRQ